MSGRVPFLYLPDAVSLLLLWIALVLLRKAAVEHVRIELARLGDELWDYWVVSGLPPEPRVTSAFESLVGSMSRLAERVSPARLYFVRRCAGQMVRAGQAAASRDPLAELDARLDAITHRRTRERLRYLRLELALRLGVFYALASASGWVLASSLGLRVAWRVWTRPGRDRIDRFVDFAERLAARLGRQAVRLALLADAPSSLAERSA